MCGVVCSGVVGCGMLHHIMWCGVVCGVWCDISFVPSKHNDVHLFEYED